MEEELGTVLLVLEPLFVLRDREVILFRDFRESVCFIVEKLRFDSLFFEESFKPSFIESGEEMILLKA